MAFGLGANTGGGPGWMSTATNWIKENPNLLGVLLGTAAGNELGAKGAALNQGIISANAANDQRSQFMDMLKTMLGGNTTATNPFAGDMFQQGAINSALKNAPAPTGQFASNGGLTPTGQPGGDSVTRKSMPDGSIRETTTSTVQAPTVNQRNINLADSFSSPF